LIGPQGHSYAEIAEITQWSATKVNRCITEGRRSFLHRYAEIGSGAECRRWEPVLSALVDGEASAKDLAGVRPHLRNCPGCRDHVRALRESSAGLAALLPVPALLAGGEGSEHGLLARLVEAVTGPIHDRIALSAAKLQSGVEAALPGKLAVVAASAAAVAGGGVAVERAVTAGHAHRAPSVHAAARPARHAAPALPTVHAPALPAGPPEPRAPAQRRRREPRRVAAARTRNREFARPKPHARAASATSSTAAREFAPATPSATAAAATPPTVVSVAPPPHATRSERTAAAEFGGG
jgi:hypothetical protein